MRICFVPTMFPKYKGDYYGSFVFDDARMLVKKGFEIHVVTQHNSNIPYEEIMDGIHIHRFKWLEPKEFRALVHFNGLIDNFRLITYLISLFFKLMWTTRKYNIDIIHSHSAIPTGFIGVIVAKIMKKPVLITAHGMDINNFEGNTFFKRLIKFSLNNCNKTIAVSKNLASKMMSFGVEEEKIIVLRNAVDTNRFKPLKNKTLRNSYNIKENTVLILFIGYLDIFKGIFELIDAFYEVNTKNRNTKLIIIGEGPKEEELKEKVLEMGLKKSVIFTGKISPADIPKYYQSADIFVLPSHTEGFPLVIIEAMACGLPVIASSIGGIPEIIEDNVNGFLVSPHDISVLVYKLNILINNPNLREKFAHVSLKIIEKKFSANKKIEKLVKLYKNEMVP